VAKVLAASTTYGKTMWTSAAIAHHTRFGGVKKLSGDELERRKEKEEKRRGRAIVCLHLRLHLQQPKQPKAHLKHTGACAHSFYFKLKV
jgi:hypothetical protein